MLTGRMRGFILAVLLISMAVSTDAQSSRSRTRPNENQKAQRPTQPLPEASPEPTPLDDQRDVETVKVETNLVSVPVIATDLNGVYIPDLKQEEFAILEDGVKQDIAFFATVSAPFHVVLMLDTSASTQEKLSLIQRAASAFVEQLQSFDRVKVISFDDKIRELNDFTNDRAALRAAIYRTRSGQGTKLYDAFELALASFRKVQGRKAIVLFTDGVDFHSDRASFDGTLRGLDEEGVLVYPIRYNTREETERIAREQSEGASQLPTLGTIRTPPTGTTAPTFPSDDPDTVPTSGPRPRTGPFGLPLPEEILRRRRESERDRDQNRLPPSDRMPPPDRTPDASDPGGSWPDRRNDPTYPTGRGSRRSDDSISAMLDQLYLTADSYLKQLAEKSGGRVLRADTLNSLPGAFARIAAELRTQYLIGYYPIDKTRDDRYRRIKVNSTRKNVIIRARPGYRPAGAQ
jgi:hypothetical protein